MDIQRKFYHFSCDHSEFWERREFIWKFKGILKAIIKQSIKMGNKFYQKNFL